MPTGPPPQPGISGAVYPWARVVLPWFNGGLTMKNGGLMGFNYGKGWFNGIKKQQKW